MRGGSSRKTHSFTFSFAFNAKKLFANYKFVLEEAEDAEDAGDEECSDKADDE